MEISNDNEQTPSQEYLPFHKKKQDAILGYMLTTPKFFLQCRNYIQPAWFVEPHCGLVFKAMLEWFKTYNRPGTPEEIIHSPYIAQEKSDLRPKLVAKIHQCIHETSNFGLDGIANEMTMWMKSRLYINGVTASQKSFNTGRFDETYRSMDATLREIKNATFMNEHEEDFSNWREDITLTLQENSKGLTFGLKTIDDLLLPGNEHGSLMPGDTTILLAPTNVGKTTTMITTLVANIKNAKHVLFLTHEGRPADIKQKIRMAYLGMDRNQLFNSINTEEGVQEMEMATKMIDRFLTYMPLNKAGLTVEEVEPLIRRKQEERMARNNGKGYSMLVCDYPAKLTTKLAAGGHMNKRNIDEIVYGYFVQLALEYGFHSFLAIQTNREGSRVNKGQRDEGRLLVMEDVHESYGVMMEATNVITLNRDQVAKARNYMTFHIDKSRSSETGFAVVARTDFARATTHSDKLGSIWYRGVATMADKVDDLLQNPDNNGKEIDILALT